MSMTNDAAAQPTPTEQAPDRGVIHHVTYDIELCQTECWVEDGVWVVRATDFDLLALGDDRAAAVQAFVGEVYSLWKALVDLPASEKTDAEQELLLRLSRPIIDAFRRDQEADERRQSRLIDSPRLRRRGDHPRWRAISNRANSNLPSLV